MNYYTKSAKSLQEQNEALIDSIYTEDKKKVWQTKMDLYGKQFENAEISFTEYMQKRRELRMELGFPE